MVLGRRGWEKTEEKNWGWKIIKYVNGWWEGSTARWSDPGPGATSCFLCLATVLLCESNRVMACTRTTVSYDSPATCPDFSEFLFLLRQKDLLKERHIRREVSPEGNTAKSFRELKCIFGQDYMPGLEPAELLWQEVWFCLTKIVMNSTSRLITSLWPKIVL